MSIVSEKLLTAEEFGQLPNPIDGSQQELVRGEVITMPPPKPLHGFSCSKLAWFLTSFVERKKLGRVFSNDVGFVTETDPDTVRGIDVAYWSFKQLPQIPTEYPRAAPEIAAEVLSPGQSVNHKIDEYLACGVSLVWIVDPKTRTVAVHREGREPVILDENARLSGEDVLPGFECEVSQIFDV